MTGSLRVVLDTNVLVSAALTPDGQARRTVDLVARRGLVLFSDATYAELLDVLARPRLRRYLPPERAEEFARRIVTVASRVVPVETIRACRDPKDDPFLDVAVGGRADFLVSGDLDLLVLHPFRGIPVLTPAAVLVEAGAEERRAEREPLSRAARDA